MDINNWRQDTQHNDTRQNDTQYNYTEHFETNQINNNIMLSGSAYELSIVTLSIVWHDWDCHSRENKRDWTGQDRTRLNGNSIGIENTVYNCPWTVNEIRQYCSQWTWRVSNVHGRWTVLSHLYHKILLVLIKTCF